MLTQLALVKMPSMILQPIVENSVNYGIRNIEWESLIILSVYGEDGRTCISIKDNGVGISPEKLEKIMTKEIEKSDIANDSNGVGLENVISRLQMYFETDDIFTIKSEGENKGTEVIIRLPMDREGAE